MITWQAGDIQPAVTDSVKVILLMASLGKSRGSLDEQSRVEFQFYITFVYSYISRVLFSTFSRHLMERMVNCDDANNKAIKTNFSM